MQNDNVDRMTLEVLEDGTAKLLVDGISGANHTSADRLVGEFAKLLGGEPTITKRKVAHGHAHQTHGQKADQH